MINRRTLVIVSIAFIATMCVLVPWLTKTLGPTNGYLAVFCMYWFGFCLPLGFIFQGKAASQRNLSLAVGKERWVPWVVMLQVGLICTASAYLLPADISWIAIILAAACGIINGFSEEYFWRGAFLEQGRGMPLFQIFGVGLFCLWHVPLTLAYGVTYEGGALALIGGALFLGAFWSVISYRTNRIGWPIVSHVLTNAVAFIGLISTNFI